MERVVIIQQIKTVWTKASRGGPGAVRRNAVPEVARVPLDRVRDKNLRILHHQLTCGERGEVSRAGERLAENTTLRPLQLGCVTIDYSDEAVYASFRYDRWHGGAPDRGWAHKKFTLGLNEWGQIVYNGRFSHGWDGNWWYEKTVVNVGAFNPLSGSVFTRCEPHYRFSAVGRLH